MAKNRYLILLEILPGFLQLHELHFAIGSPAGTAVYHHKGPAISTRSVHVDQTTALIRQADVGET